MFVTDVEDFEVISVRIVSPMELKLDFAVQAWHGIVLAQIEVPVPLVEFALINKSEMGDADLNWVANRLMQGILPSNAKWDASFDLLCDYCCQAKPEEDKEAFKKKAKRKQALAYLFNFEHFYIIHFQFYEH